MVRRTRRVEPKGVGVGKKFSHMEDITNLHVEGEVKGTTGRGWSLDDLEGADEPGLELGGFLDVLEVEVMGGEANYVTNRVGHMARMHVGMVQLTVLSMGDGVMSVLDIVTNELEARCSRWVGGINEKGGGEERMMIIVEEEGGEASGGRDGVVVIEIQRRKDNVPLNGVGANKWAKHLLDGAVCYLG